jgi:hypothetical protein
MNRVLAVGVAIGSTLAAAAAGQGDPPPRAAPDVAALVRRLGSEDFPAREAASAALVALAVDEPPAELLAALQSADPEVRRRAADAVRAIRAAAARRPLTRDGRFAARGQADLYVASAAALTCKAEDDRLWEPAFKLAVRAVRDADMGQRGPYRFAHCGFAEYRKNLIDFACTDGTYTRLERDADGGLALTSGVAAQASAVRLEFLWSGQIVSRGPVGGRNWKDSCVLANGDVTLEGVHGSVVVCDGDATFERVSNSLIVARGKIAVRGYATACTLIAGGTVTVGELTAAQRRPAIAPPRPGEDMVFYNKMLQQWLLQKKLDRVDVRERDANPLGFIAFFELWRVGLTVATADGPVTVARVATGLPCATAGLKAGDVILSVGGKKPADAEALRRLLRDALAVGPAAVAVRRGGETLTVTMALPD